MSSSDDYARQVIKAGRDLGITPRGIAIGLATVIVESGLPIRMWANQKVPESLRLPHDAVGNDGYSVGLQQQQIRRGPTGEWWWSDCATCMDPYKSSRLFFERLAKRNYNTGDAGAHAQAVQESAFPDRYAQRMGEAQQLYDRLAPQVGGNIPEPPISSGGIVPDYGITQTKHGFNPDTPANATGNSNGPRARTDFVVIHTEEGNSTAPGLADYCNRNQVSYNLIVDDRDTVEVVPVGEAPWAAADANGIGVHICFAGSRAAWTRDQWLAHSPALDRAAKATAAACQQYNIPAVKIPANNGWPAAGQRGIAAHGDFGARGGGHHDPGVFIWDDFVARVNRFMQQPTTTPTAPTGGITVPDSQLDRIERKADWIIAQLGPNQWGPDSDLGTNAKGEKRTLRDALASLVRKAGA